MSDTVLGWLFGGWFFGRSPDNDSAIGRAERGRVQRSEERQIDERTSTTDTDDQRLVARVRAGDESAFEALFLRYYTPLVEFATSYVGSIDDAEEVVASVLAWVWEHRATWTATPGVTTYLFGAVRNRALNAIKRRAFHNQQTVVLSALSETPGIAPTSLGPAEQAERDDYTAALLRLIAKLPERRRLILSLRWTHELAWDEIAAVLGVTRAAVQREHSRILEGLRAELRAL